MHEHCLVFLLLLISLVVLGSAYKKCVLILMTMSISIHQLGLTQYSSLSWLSNEVIVSYAVLSIESKDWWSIGKNRPRINCEVSLEWYGIVSCPIERGSKIAANLTVGLENATRADLIICKELRVVFEYKATRIFSRHLVVDLVESVLVNVLSGLFRNILISHQRLDVCNNILLRAMLLRELRSSCFVAHTCRTQLLLNVFDQSDCQSFSKAVFLFLMTFLAHS